MHIKSGDATACCSQGHNSPTETLLNEKIFIQDEKIFIQPTKNMFGMPHGIQAGSQHMSRLHQTGMPYRHIDAVYLYTHEVCTSGGTHTYRRPSCNTICSVAGTCWQQWCLCLVSTRCPDCTAGWCLCINGAGCCGLLLLCLLLL